MVSTIQYNSNLVAPPLCEGTSWGDCLPIANIKRVSETPDKTRSFQPIPHHVGVDLVETHATRRGFQMSEPRHYVSKNRQQFWSMYTIQHSLLPGVEGMSWEMAVRNSSDKSMSFAVAGGDRLFVCANGMLTAESFFKTRHTTNVWDRVHQIIDASLSNILERSLKRVHQMNTYKNLDAGGDRFVDHVVVEAMRRDIINPAGIKEVLDHWHTPEHAEFKDRNVWSLMNAFTSRDRGRSPFGHNGHQKRMSSMVSLLDEAYDVPLYDPATDSGTQPSIIQDARDF